MMRSAALQQIRDFRFTQPFIVTEYYLEKHKCKREDSESLIIE